MAVGSGAAAHGVVVLAERIASEGAVHATALIIRALFAFADIISVAECFAPGNVQLKITRVASDVAACYSVDVAAYAIYCV